MALNNVILSPVFPAVFGAMDFISSGAQLTPIKGGGSGNVSVGGADVWVGGETVSVGQP